jgi:hypothetical protein
MAPRIFNQLDTKAFEAIRMNDSLGLDVARNELVIEFLKTNCDWLLFMDDDVVACKDLMRIFDVEGAQIVAPYSNSFHEEPIISVYQWMDDKREMLATMPREAMQDVFKRCKEAGIRPIYPIGDVVGNCYAVRRGVFARTIDEDGEWFKQVWRSPSGALRRGEDTYFFRRCNALGINVHVAFDVRVGHHKMVDMAQLYDAYHGEELKWE